MRMRFYKPVLGVVFSLFTTAAYAAYNPYSVNITPLATPNATNTLLNIVTPQMFGGTCNGSADDSTAMAAAISASTTTGFIIDIPANSVCIVDSVTLPTQGQTLNIEPGATLKQSSSTSGTDAFIKLGATHQTIQGGGTIDGNYSAGGGHPFAGIIQTNNYDYATIQNLTIQNLNGYGIQAGNSNYFTASDLNFANTWRAPIEAVLTAAVTNTTIKNIYIDRTAQGTAIADGNIVLHGTTSFYYSNSTFENIKVVNDNPDTFTGRVGLEVWYCRQCHFSKINTFGSAIGTSLADLVDSTVSDVLAVQASSYGIEFPDNNNVAMSNLVVEGNNLTNNGITFDGSFSSNNITLSNPTVEGTLVTGIAAFNTNSGISISNPNVTVNNAGAYALELQASQNWSVTGGFLKGSSTSDTGIFLDRSWNGQVSGVNVNGFAGVCLFFHSTAADTFVNTTFTGNNFSSCGGAVASVGFPGGAVFGSGMLSSANVGPICLAGIYGGCAETWTPTLIGSTSGAASYSSRSGWYKIDAEGNITANFSIVTTSVASISGSYVNIGGFPYASSGGANDLGQCTFSEWEGLTLPASQTQLNGFINPGSATAFFSASGSGASAVTLAPSAFANATTLFGQCMYHTN